MHYTTFKKIGDQTSIHFPHELLQTLPCGLHRAPLDEAESLLPELKELYDSAMSMLISQGYIPSEFVIDVKIHMLMSGQFPCIPNWHCDNIKRKPNGEIQYDSINEDAVPMFLWLSEGPCTEFLDHDGYTFGQPITNHGELHEFIERDIHESAKKAILPQQWISMKQNTPHRGSQATKDGWRIFVRLTHKSIDSDRPVISKLRRHCQVYLPRDFHW